MSIDRFRDKPAPPKPTLPWGDLSKPDTRI